MLFAVGVLELASQLPKTFAGRHLSTQLVRAATSVGANYEEARAAESRSDFIHKLRIAAKEARESSYWLQLARRAELVTDGDRSLEALCSEAPQLAAILVASARTARANEI